MRFYLACKKAKVPVEMHIYEKGRHGVGLGRDPKWTGGEKSVETWPDRLAEWMKARVARSEEVTCGKFEIRARNRRKTGYL
ncbi:MAG: hypothetical protein U0792_07580 [Gemmataceae bacterium]